MEKQNMSVVVVLVTVVLFFIVVLAINSDRRTPEERAALEKQAHQDHVNRIICDIKYIKDPRTGYCFAYFWEGSANGGPALALVPEEAIPPEFLTIADVGKNTDPER